MTSAAPSRRGAGRRARVSPIAFGAAVVALCGVTAAAPAATPKTTTRPKAASTTRATARPALSVVEWIVAHAHQALTQAEFDTRFAASFRGAVTLSQLNEGFQSLTGGTPLRLAAAPAAVAGETRFVVIAASGERVVGHLGVDAAGRINALFFQQESLISPKPLAPATMGLGLANYAPDQGWLVSEIRNGTCRRIDGDDAGLPKPVASVFKLIVLASLADAVSDGRIQWDDKLLISERTKSIPSGQLQERSEGSTVSVRDAARLMVSISDNTAADLLIRLIGRERIEADQRRYGMTDPALNIPFLTTREMAQLKVGAARTRAAEYVGSATAEKRRILEEIGSEPLPADIVARASSATPVLPHQLEWFATMEDVCRLHARLRSQADKAALAPLQEILGSNPGVPLDLSVWRRVQFKGGSEPGVLALSWLLERQDGRRFFVGVALSSEAPIPEAPVVASVSRTIAWVAGR